MSGFIWGDIQDKKIVPDPKAKYYHDQLKSKFDKYLCTNSHKHKLDCKGCGLLPEQELRSEPFEEVAVNLIGPWKIAIQGKTYQFNALMCIDTMTALAKIVSVKN